MQSNICSNFNLSNAMKKILSLVVLVAAVAMVGCAGNCKKNAAAAEENKACCEQCEECKAAEAEAAPAEAVEAPAEAPAEEAPAAPEK